MKVALALVLTVVSQFAVAKSNKDVSNVHSVAVQMDVKGQTAKSLIGLLDKIGVKSSKSSSYDIRNITVQGYYDQNQTTGKITGTTYFSIIGVDHAGDYSSRQVINVDDSKAGVQELGRLLSSLGGDRLSDQAMGQKFGFNVPWISCYGKSDLGGPSCQVTIATDLLIDEDVAIGGK